jgi:hypothetical protein
MIGFSQLTSIPISFLALTFSSAQLYFSQRLGRFPDRDPSIRMVIFILPFIVLLITGPLFSLVIFATYFNAGVLIVIVVNITASFLVLKNVYVRKRPYPYTEHLYSRFKKMLQFGIQQGEREPQAILYTAVLTSWVSPCTVWTNNVQCKSLFLLLSNLISSVVHLLSYIVISIGFSIAHLPQNISILQCFKNKDISTNANFRYFQGNYSTSDILKICDDDQCLPVFRICSDDETSTKIFTGTVAPIGITLVVVSFIAALCLQTLGNYYKIFQWSKLFWPSSPILHFSLLQDCLQNWHTMSDSKKEELKTFFSQEIKKNKAIINQKDPLFGDTLAHEALEKDLFEILEEIIVNGGDCFIGNIFRSQVLVVYDEINSRIQNSTNTDERNKLLKLKHLIENRQQNRLDSFTRKDSVMHEHAMEGKLGILCVLKILGGHFGTKNSEDKCILEILLEQIEANKIDWNKMNHFVKWIIINARDETGSCMIHYATQFAMLNSLQQLIDNGADVNATRFELGDTALHYAAAFTNNDECGKLLIFHKANVGAKNLLNKTPLDTAKMRKNEVMEQLLLSCNV